MICVIYAYLRETTMPHLKRGNPPLVEKGPQGQAGEQHYAWRMDHH
jgi:hypothetical protein